MTVSAVVVRWRGGSEVERCLRSLLDHGGPSLGRVVLVDSGSGDGGAERLAARFPDIEVLALAANRSFAHAANVGAASCGNELLLLLNPDATVETGTLDALVNEIAKSPGVAGAVPLMVGPNGEPQHRWQLRRLPTAFRLAAGLAGAPAFGRPPEVTAFVEQPAAAAWLVRRSVWQQLGGFDEAFAPAWWEDVDFCARLAGRLDDAALPADAGFVVAPSARVVHIGGSSVAELGDAAFLAAWSRNLVRFAARHHPHRTGAIAAGLRVSLMVRAVLRPARSAAYLAARRGLRRRSSA